MTRPSQSAHPTTDAPRVQPMAPEPPSAVPTAGPSLLQRVLGWALAGVAGFFTLGLLLVFAVLAFVLGNHILGSILLLLLLLGGISGAVLGVRTAQRGLQQGRTPPGRVQQQIGAVQEQVRDETTRRDLLRLWEHYSSRIPNEVRPALRSALASADEALQAVDDPLSRERYEVQQAASHDLPELLAAYTRSGGDSAALMHSLELIDRRLRQLTVQAEQERQREFEVRREYISGKYAADPLDEQ